MRKTLIEIYALAVCFFTVACFAIFSGLAVWDVVQISAPEFTINSKVYEEHSDNESYKKRSCYACADQLEAEKSFSEGEITQSREKGWERELEIEKRSAVQSFARNLIIIIIDIILFWGHWVLAQRTNDKS